MQHIDTNKRPDLGFIRKVLDASIREAMLKSYTAVFDKTLQEQCDVMKAKMRTELEETLKEITLEKLEMSQDHMNFADRMLVAFKVNIESGEVIKDSDVTEIPRHLPRTL
jgi:hypothetical protein